MLTLAAFREEESISLKNEKQRIKCLKDIVLNLSLNGDEISSDVDNLNVEIQHKTNEGKSNISKLVPENVCPSIQLSSKKSNNYFFSTLMTTPLYLQLGAYEHKRRKLAEERRREYNEYLKEKAKLETERRQKHRFPTSSFRLPNYNEILEKKRNENKEFRRANGFDVDEPLIESPQMTQNLVKNDKSNIPPSASFFFGCADDSDEEKRITPRHRLLRTRFSREKADEYRKELLEQIEEKKKRELMEKEMAEVQERKFNIIIAEQQKRISSEFRNERTRLDFTQKVGKKEPARLSPLKCCTPKSLSSKDLGYRSPSYLQVKPARYEKHLSMKNIDGHPNTRNSLKDYEPAAKRAETEHKNTDINNKIKINEDAQKESVAEKSHALTRLSEVRRKMQEDHLQMLQQLREKEIL